MEPNRVNKIAELANKASKARKNFLEMNLHDPDYNSKANEFIDTYNDSCKEIWLIVKSWEES